MIKKLCILLLSVCTVAPLMAQQYSSGDNALFAPQKGQWQVSVVLGNGTFLDESKLQELLPQYPTGGSTTIPSVGLDKDPAYYLNLGDLNNNNLVNIVGIQGKYFLTDRIDLNLMFSMNINLTPKKDYVEGDNSVPDMNIPAYKYLNAKMTNNWLVAVGSNYYFQTRNARINPYLGGVFGFQMGRIETNRPYTGDFVSDPDGTTLPDGSPNEDGSTLPDGGNISDSGTSDLDTNLPIDVYVPTSRAGQAFGINVGAVAGIEYSIASGLVLGFEIQPVSYRYNVLQICPKGFDKYSASNHNIKIMASPVLKLGIRF